MAAPRGSVSDVESSSSDEEELARCREAAMPAWGLEQPAKGPGKPKADAAGNQLPVTQPSLRHKVDEHEQDGNKLQTTPEFRAHVAKKLGALLDSSITISEAVKEQAKTGAQKAPPEDDGFRLFFTSIPKGLEKKAPPQPRRKRVPSSSSSESSDEERQRCREAAVSASAILQGSAIHSPGPVEKKVKKKKKKKARKEASSGTAAASTSMNVASEKQGQDSAELCGGLTSPGTKEKERKKKTKKPREASPGPPARSEPAAPAK
ncbi:protein CUSTOS isoform X2 [Erinaceus europaeus]|uniref:Protein CUSTOS n=1 Tax=Erinaceus europaeus TaxID=9365 RepID=A0A1S2ZVR7_ERIEU|nr:protein CUSTOS isoform X2 [Erinaceus europaeus]